MAAVKGETLAVRRSVPPLARRHLARLPFHLAERHRAEIEALSPPRLTGVAEAVKQFETTSSHRLVMSASGVGWLIQATVGSLGGAGRRCPKRPGLAA